MANKHAIHIYRNLLRTVPLAVRQDRPATKNIRRLLRDDFASAVKEGASPEKLERRAADTLLLYLASAKSKAEPTPEYLMVHRAVANISSLCYHHLSPHTRLQPINKKTKVGGTNTAGLRRRRSLATARAGRSSPLDSFETDSAESAASVASTVLMPLVVPPKPIRGPIYPTDARRTLPPPWDGQRPVRVMQTSPAYIAHLESLVDTTRQQIGAAKEQYGPLSPELQRLQSRLVQEKGALKSANTLKKKEDKIDGVQREAASLLQSVFVKVQRGQGPWIGADRITRWAAGGWLPP